MKKTMFLILMLAFVFVTHAEIRQELGVDSRVDYRSLTQYGPWDDRNYLITQEDLAIIPDNDQYLANVPVFFKILARKDNDKIGEFYPRSLYQAFLIHQGGLLVDGIWYKEGIGRFYHPDPDDGKPAVNRGATVNPDGEIPLSAITEAGNETTIEFNPTNNMNAVAGANAAAGQTMYYSQDGGETWAISQVNPTGSCCDPTVDWSSDGSKVYQAELFNCGFGGCGVRAAVSDDQGVTWGPFVTIVDDGASDKEFIHSDRSASSPYQDNIYMTYHTGNVMQFSKSEDMGATWTAPVAVGNDTGIGSDITSDSAGNVYYVYPGLTVAGSDGPDIYVLKSTDGGDTFETPVSAATLRGRFDFPIPSMESRAVFIYVSVDVDSNDNIYISFTDETADSVGQSNGDAADNRAEIRIVKSTDGGATWTEMAKPHADDGLLTDPNPIDRFHPWLKIAENDALHIGFYDTRNSANRTGVDFYYNVSTDGGASWLPEGEQRYSTVTSDNIANGQEWGDYNGLSVVLDKIAMTWTDNRGNEQTAMAGYSENQFGSPTYNISADPNAISVCAGDVGASSEISVTGIQGYDNDVTLSIIDSPAFVSNDALSVNPVTPDGTSTLTFDVGAGEATGEYTLTIEATGDEEVPPPVLGTPQIVKSLDLAITYSAEPANGTILASPADEEEGVPFTPTFLWTLDINALEYLVEVATDADFNDVIASANVDIPKWTPEDDLPSSTTLYWRVTSLSGCGDEVSEVFSFTTDVAPGECPIGTPVAEFASYDFESGDQGWTSSALIGINTWVLSGLNVNSGVQSFHADNVAEISDQVLVSPAIDLPTDNSPLVLRFWNNQDMEINGEDCYDGGILEVSTDGGATYTKVEDSAFINGGYDGTINDGFENPLANELAWCGGGNENALVDLSAYEGETVNFRYRIATDSSVSAPGWDIDDVQVTGCGEVVPSDIIFANGFE